MCVLLYSHMKSLLVWLGVKDGKRREIAENGFTLYNRFIAECCGVQEL